MPKYRNSLNVDPNDDRPINLSTILSSTDGHRRLFYWPGSPCQRIILGFLYPNAMKIPPSVFSIGRPEEVLSHDGKVFNPKQKVFIETEAGKVSVQTAVCTHLGCTVNVVQNRICMSLSWFHL